MASLSLNILSTRIELLQGSNFVKHHVDSFLRKTPFNRTYLYTAKVLSLSLRKRKPCFLYAVSQPNFHVLTRNPARCDCNMSLGIFRSLNVLIPNLSRVVTRPCYRLRVMGCETRISEYSDELRRHTWKPRLGPCVLRHGRRGRRRSWP